MVQRWKPSWVQGRMIPAGVHPIDGYVSAADHARIVAEAGAAVFAFHPEWTVTGMCDSDCLACRRLTELITEREKGYEEGKADAEQAHAAAWDRATFDSTAYEQGKRDAAEEARAAERRHWEARFRNAEAAHAAALAGSMDECAWLWNEVDRWIDKYYTDSAPRTLTADDPEPAVGSVVLGRYEISGQRVMDDDEETTIWRFSDGGWCYEWATVQRMYGPVTLIHDGGAA